MSTQHIVIVGSGFGGLGMGIRLKQAGIHDFTILEQGAEVGGTWRDNHYPGAACDVESHLYSYSFEPNPRWSRRFAPQQEILSYLIHCADKYQVRPHIRFGCAATSARFDDPSGTWEVNTSDGKTIHCRTLVAACGGLSKPAIPDLPGLDSFAGKVFHSARWDHSYSLSGKRVAVIGTGASAIQIVPAIASQVAKLSVFQRSPPWIIPKPDRRIKPDRQQRYADHPLLQRLTRTLFYLIHELAGVGFVVEPKLFQLLSRLVKKYIARSIPDESLRAQLTPNYTLGCKRILLSNDYYPALCQPQVELVTAPIETVTRSGIRTADGEDRAFDAIILATGFAAADVVSPFPILGRNGVDLSDAWKDGAEAYLGTAISGFPNAFLIVGPNTGLGHNSMVFMIESQIAYILSAIQAMRQGKLCAVEVKSDVQTRYNAAIQERLKHTVWSSGCTSWYQAKNGRNTTLWPGFTFEFRLRTRRFSARDYVIEKLTH
jgi:cation diffusion facilitator CzcD-associated flavoprotein CzcO